MFFSEESIEIFPQTCSGIVDQYGENLLRVRALGSIWNATIHEHCAEMRLTCGQIVNVVGRKGIGLIVMPMECHLQLS